MLMRDCERFCRVRALTYCIRSNRFHLLVEVPMRPDVLPGPEKVLEELERLSGHQFPGAERNQAMATPARPYLGRGGGTVTR